MKYGKLTPLEDFSGKLKVNFRCDCGTVKPIIKYDVISGKTISCGCHRNSIVIARNKSSATRDGLTHTRTGSSWNCMMTRCYNQNATDYPKYGAVGILACEFLKLSPNRWSISLYSGVE